MMSYSHIIYTSLLPLIVIFIELIRQYNKFFSCDIHNFISLVEEITKGVEEHILSMLSLLGSAYNTFYISHQSKVSVADIKKLSLLF